MLLMLPIPPCKHDMSKEAKRLRQELLDELTQLYSVLECGECDLPKITKEISTIQRKLKNL